MDHDIKIYKYDHVYTGELSVNWDDSITTRRQEMHARYIKYGWAAFDRTPDSWRSIANQLDNMCRGWSLSPTVCPRLYFSPHCRMRRDLFRNAGYTITMNPDNADAIVVPFIKDKEQMRGHVITWEPDTKILTFYSMDTDDIPDGDYERHVLFDKIAEHFAGKNVEFVFGNLARHSYPGYFMPKYDVYEEMLTGDGSKTYIQETTFRLNPPLEISVDTLHLWSKIYDDNVLADAICNSDWIDYPATLLVFLCMERPSVNVNNTTFSLVCNKIGFDRTYNLSEMLKGKVIQPKDWNMLQDYLMYRCGLPEEGGVIKNIGEIRHNIKDMIRCATMIKPKRISVPMSYEQLQCITV